MPSRAASKRVPPIKALRWVCWDVSLLAQQGNVFLAEFESLLLLVGLVLNIEFGHLLVGRLVEQGVFEGRVALVVAEGCGVIGLAESTLNRIKYNCCTL